MWGYYMSVSMICTLKQNIRDEVAAISPNVLQRVM